MEEKEHADMTLYSTDEKYEDALFTPWTAVHTLSGAAMKGLGLDWVTTFGIHLLYEAKDRSEHDEGSVYNSMLNSFGDQTACMIGWHLTPKKYNAKYTLWFVAAYILATSLRDQIG